jgi:phosphomannomutase
MRSASTERALDRSLVTDEGVRGIYLNELDRTRATDWGSAFASFLWEEQPRIGRSAIPDGFRQAAEESITDADAGSPVIAEASSPIPSLVMPTRSRRGPVVVIGFDERPSSPDMIVGVALGLRRMGCHVIDLGQTTRPCFHFSVHHLEAAGGVFVTGSGCDPASTGFHFAGRGSQPWLRTDLLLDLESRAKTRVVRPTRTAGAQRPFHASIPYQSGLWKLFHALRPLHVVCGSATRQLPRILDALFARLPCRLTHDILPVRHRDLGNPNDVDVRRVASTVVAGQHHLGLIVDDDCERCAFVTDRGELVSPADLARLLVLFELHEHRAARVVIDEALFPQLADLPMLDRHACQRERSPAHELPTALMQLNAGLGFSADHRVWFGGAYPACNAILTLARVLQALSLSDAAMSEVLPRME